jgi:hypothetical protein
MFVTSGASISAALDRLLSRLADPRHRERAVLVVLGCYWVLWSAYAVIAKSSQDIHFDMGEAVVWSHESPGFNPKHPPLSAWPVWLWFHIFPQTDWAYYTLAVLLAVVALYAAWRVSAYFLPDEKRVAALALLTLVPFFNFHALKYNANAVMIPLWALATWALVVAFKTLRPLPAALAGLAAGAAMLGKYWSIFLLLGLGIAVLAHPDRRKYFRSASPWITIAVGALVLAPHVILLLSPGNTTFAYAMQSHPGTLWTALVSGGNYIVGTLGYFAFPAIVAWLAVMPSRAALADTLWPKNADRRFAVIAFAVPILLPVVAALATKEVIVSLWSIGGAALLGVVLLGSPLVTLSRMMARRILGIAIAVPLIALAASPGVAYLAHRRGLDNHAAHYRLVAQAAEKAWQDVTHRPVAIFGSYDNLLYAASFYFSTPPRTFEIVTPRATPWTSEANVARDGIVMVCPADDGVCMNALNARAAKGPNAVRLRATLARRWFGIRGPFEAFAIVVIPPASPPQ